MKLATMILVLIFVLAACSGSEEEPVAAASEEVNGLAREAPEFDPDVEISEDSYRIEDVECRERTGNARIDGESVPEQQWILVGRLTNLLDVDSPHYSLVVDAELSDGTSFESDASFEPLSAGESDDFLIFVGGQTQFDDPEATIVGCDVTAFDSVLNFSN